MDISEEPFSEELRELKDENSRLHKLLAEKNLELKNVLKKLDLEKSLVQTNLGSDAASTKIIELSKKLREQTAELEGEKTKVKQWQKKCLDFERQINFDRNKNVNNKEDDEKEETENKVSELRATQEKLRLSEIKVCDYKNQIQTLKTEAKLLQKIIGQEVGENVPIQSLLSSPGSWKGRNQQIVSLQKKISDLKKQLNEITESKNRSTCSNSNEELESSFFNSSVISNNETMRIKQIERSKKESLEKVTNDLKLLNEEMVLMKEKYEAVKARNQTLLNDNKTSRQKIRLLLDKEKHDNELIEALMKKQNLLKEALMDETKHKKGKTSTGTEDKNELNQLKIIVAEKNLKIKELEEKLIKMSSYDEFKTQQQPFKLSTSLDSLDDTEQVAPICPHDQISACGEHTDLAKEAFKMKTMYLETTVERDRLVELVQVLEKRIQLLTTQSTTAECELRAQLKKNAHLEKQLGRLKLDKNQSSSKTFINGAGDSAYDMEDLLLKLEIQRDENNALKAGLQSTLKSKEEDCKFYMNMLEDAKKIFVDGIKLLKSNSVDDRQLPG